MTNSQLYKIGSICDVKTGKLDANASSVDGAYPFFTCSKETLRISSYSYDLECVLLAGNGDLNVKYYNGKFDAYQRTYIISLKKGVSNVSVPYLYHFFLLYVEVLRKKSIGGVIKYIKLGDITEAHIPIPSLPEQERIVAELDLLSGIIDKYKQQLKELDTLAQSVFYDMFGDPEENERKWEMKTIGEACCLTMGQSPTSDTYNKDGRGIPFFQGCSDFGDMFPAITTYCSAPTKIAEKNDVLMSVRAPIGTLNLANVRCCIGRGLASFRQIKTTTHFYYLFFFLKSVNKVLQEMGTGATFKAIGKSTITDFPIPIPPIDLQNAFAEKIEAIEKQKESVKQAIRETDVLFNSRMDHYFN